MPRKAKELSPLEIKKLKHPGVKTAPARVAVGGIGGLCIQITPDGAKSWVVRINSDPIRCDLGLGSYPEIGLAEAKEAAREAKALARKGINPKTARDEARAARLADQRKNITFEQAVDGYMALRTDLIEKNWKATRSRFDLYCSDLLTRQISGIDKHDIKGVLEPIWQSKTNTATRLRLTIQKVFEWAIGNDHMEGANPAVWAGCLEYLLPAPKQVVKHKPSVSQEDAPRCFAMAAEVSDPLAFLALTASRSGEVRGATWDEIDFERGIWTIPASRMKAGKEHRVPLPKAAVELIEALPRTDQFIFPGARGGQLADATLSAAMRDIHRVSGKGFKDEKTGELAVPHGWRSTFRVWAMENNFDRDMAEIALAHAVGSRVEQAYQRSDMLDKRREMMDAWAAFLNSTESNLVQLRPKSA